MKIATHLKQKFNLFRHTADETETVNTAKGHPVEAAHLKEMLLVKTEGQPYELNFTDPQKTNPDGSPIHQRLVVTWPKGDSGALSIQHHHLCLGSTLSYDTVNPRLVTGTEQAYVRSAALHGTVKDGVAYLKISNDRDGKGVTENHLQALEALCRHAKETPCPPVMRPALLSDSERAHRVAKMNAPAPAA